MDDFGSHLDPKRSKLLKQIVKNLGQTFLTAPSFDSEEESYILQVSKFLWHKIPRQILKNLRN
jgi:recombinational DNA repair ATPase RecF